MAISKHKAIYISILCLIVISITIFVCLAWRGPRRNMSDLIGKDLTELLNEFGEPISQEITSKMEPPDMSAKETEKYCNDTIIHILKYPEFIVYVNINGQVSKIERTKPRNAR